jgi:short-subunit dehydrogenase
VRHILLVGATGAFGGRLAAMLARWPDVELILAARRTGPLVSLAASLSGPARVEISAFDRDAPDLTQLSLGGRRCSRPVPGE